MLHHCDLQVPHHDLTACVPLLHQVVLHLGTSGHAQSILGTGTYHHWWKRKIFHNYEWLVQQHYTFCNVQNGSFERGSLACLHIIIGPLMLIIRWHHFLCTHSVSHSRAVDNSKGRFGHFKYDVKPFVFINVRTMASYSACRLCKKRKCSNVTSLFHDFKVKVLQSWGLHIIISIFVCTRGISGECNKKLNI